MIDLALELHQSRGVRPSFHPPLPTRFVSKWFLLFGVLTLSIGQLSAATPADTATGARLFRAQLPAGTVVAATDCEPLSRAVVRAIYADRSHAPDILLAALSPGLDEKKPLRRSCKCVVFVFRSALIVAPGQASGLLDAAASLYPECADALNQAVDAAGDKNPVSTDAKDRAPAQASRDPNAARNTTGDPGTVGDPGDLGDHDFSGLGFGGLGEAAGFPGAPGFVGSAPGGSIALPPISTAVTSVINQ